MKKHMKLASIVVLLLVVCLTAPVMAQEKAAGLVHKLNWMELVTTFIYGMMGIILSMIGYKVYDIITPFDIHKEIAEDQNVSLGIVLGAIIFGVSIIVAATIHS